ncbi:MAG: hypothetical protein REI11_19125 [Patulibacter sp.]|nr:hypothetical protein [Patulibacter sp.]
MGADDVFLIECCGASRKLLPGGAIVCRYCDVPSPHPAAVMVSIPRYAEAELLSEADGPVFIPPRAGA